VRWLYFPRGFAPTAMAVASVLAVVTSTSALSSETRVDRNASVGTLIPVAAAFEVGGRNVAPVPVGPPPSTVPGAPESGPAPTATTVPGSGGAVPDSLSPFSSPASTAPVVTKPPVRNVVITGHGYGHGRGLGQWGAFGYAVDKGWDYRKILGHFYGGTGVGKLNPSSAIGVRLLSQDGKTVSIFQPNGRVYLTINGETVGPDAAAVAASPTQSTPSSTPNSDAKPGPIAVGVPAATLPPSAAAPVDPNVSTIPAPTTVPAILPPSAFAPGTPVAVRLQLAGTGRFVVSEATSCAGPWVVRGTVSSPSVVVSVGPAPVADKSDPASMLQLCTSTGRRAYRGDLAAVDAKPGQQLVNQVNMEDYLRGVVPAEVPAGWGSKPNGMEALKAQAVAARSYAAAERRPGLANTCDTTACQVYVGRGEFRSGGFVSFEDTRTDEAVAQTAGEIRADQSGAPVRTEFSSSTGGQSAPGAFPPVIDEGDRTAPNPHSTWSISLSAARLEAGRKLGAFRDIEVTLRDGVGPYGGRVQNLNLVFEKGKVSFKSGEFLRTYNLRSVLFNVQIVEQGATAPVGGTLPPLDSIPDDGTTGLANPNQNQSVQPAGEATTTAVAAKPSTKSTKGKTPTTVKGKAAKPKGTASVTPVPVGKKPQQTIATTPPTTVAKKKK
jgi:SpoIID/LytB domain protein